MAFGELVVGVAPEDDSNPAVLIVAIKRDAGERPVAALVERLADGLVGGEAEHHLERGHHLARGDGLECENVLDNGCLLAVDDVFAEPEAHEAVDVLDAHFLLVFVFVRPVLGKREAKPDKACPAENLGDVEEGNGDQRGKRFRLLHAERLRSNFTEEEDQNREDNRERHRARRGEAFHRKRGRKRCADGICHRVHDEYRGDVAVDIFLNVRKVLRRKLLVLL